MIEFEQRSTGAASLPSPHTRMLLASDGSTTILLQALVGEALHLRLDGVATTSAENIPDRVRELLSARPEDSVVVRRSALVTGAGVEVSRNDVIGIPNRSPAVDDVLTSNRPIGWTMNASRAGHRRESVTAGSTTWEVADGSIPCACKSYVVMDWGVPLMFIAERFNPCFVPFTAIAEERS